MKNTTILIAILLSQFSLRPLVAQGVEVLWDSFYHAATNELLNDLVLLPDGRLAGVGQASQKGRPDKGLFVLIDAESWRLSKKRHFEAFEKQVLKSVAEANDGSFYAVGHVEADGDKQGWVLRLDENGEELLSQKIGEKGSQDHLDRIVWLDNGKGLAAGHSEQLPKGTIWLLSLVGEKNEFKDPIGSGAMGRLADMQLDPQGRIWLTGNLPSDAKRGGVWLLQIDQNGFTKKAETFGGKSFETISSMAVAEDGAVLLAGQIQAAANQETDAWVVEYDAAVPVPTSYKSFLYEGDDIATSILKSPNQQRWLALRDARGVTTLASWGNEGMEETVLTLEGSANFRPVALLRTWQGAYILAGTSKDPKRKRDGIRIICFKNEETLVAKALAQPNIKCDNITFSEAEPDTYLSPNERASINFRLSNLGDLDVKEGRIRLVAEKLAHGLTVIRESQFLPYLTAKGGQKTCSFPIKGEADLAAGTSIFRIIVEVGGQQVVDVPFTVNCIKPKQGVKEKKAQIFIESPRLSGNERRVPLTDNTVKVKAKIVSARQLKAEDPKIMIGKTVQEDQKAPPTIEQIGKEGDNYIYEYTAMVALKDSANIVRLTLDDYTTDSIVFEVSEAHPDLHILAIGPSYDDLKYTAKDVRELAQAFAAQAGKGFFGQVFVDTLLTDKRTTKTQIDRAFNTLLKRYLSNELPDRIKPNDYVFVVYSGHGTKIDNRFFLVPTDYDPEVPLATTLDYKEMLDKYLNKIQCKKVLFIDACLSGSAKSTVADKTLMEAINEANSSNPGLVCFTSCSENELSFEDPAWENGAFTEALLEALEGGGLGIVPKLGEKAAPISARALHDFLKKRVSELVSKKGGVSQTPALKLNDVRETLTIFAIPGN
ncbi:MAG: caspase family protein [Saprospiraceae bacterium]|nr:caspase family protein [Saprospiraceae bacterium]